MPSTLRLQSSHFPQAPRLHRVRQAVDHVAGGASSKGALEAKLAAEPRDVSYLLQAAHVLGLLTREGEEHVLTSLGAELHRTVPESEAERELLRRAVRESEALRAWAGDLLGKRPPALELLVERAQRAGLSESTATQRAKQLLGWRTQLVEKAPRLPYPVAMPTKPLRVKEAARPASRLVSLELRAFKSFVHATVPLGPLTVFVGANASGKSNALDALRFLQGLALGHTVSDVLRGHHEGGRVLWPALRGGLAEVCLHKHKSFELGTTWQLGGQELRHAVRCAVAPTPQVQHESLRGEGLGDYLFDTDAKSLGTKRGVQRGGALSVAVRTEGGGRNRSDQLLSAKSLLGQLRPDERTHPSVAKWLPQVREAMRASVFLSVSPAAMREYTPIQATELGDDARNISSVLNSLCADADAKARILGWLSELCAPSITDIDFVETQLGDVMLQLVEASGARVSARALSDGTLRFLGQLVAMLTAPRGSILLMEEIENGLHPQRLHLLVELLEAVTRERGIQVIATTHSSLVLASLSEQALLDAVLFARVDGQPGTVVRQLRALPHFEEVRAKRRVDELFASGWLERAL